MAVAVGSCALQVGDDITDLFSMALEYDNSVNGGTVQYNGNISTIQWNTNINGTCGTRHLYRFSYDFGNRLKSAAYRARVGVAWVDQIKYTEGSITYDLNGNLKTYNRRGHTAGSLIDNLTYTYGDATRPDRLTNMVDAGDAAKGFGYTLGAADYQYDLNGNMTQDNHKGFTIAYNYLNLPQSFTKGANVITMTYTADGEKLSKALSGGGATKNYVSGIEYSGANLEAIYFSEGRCTPNGATAFNYDYTIKDHLGNARVNFRANGAAVTHLEDMHYYPFGLLMEGMGTNTPNNDYAYNGKELNEDFGLNLSDYGARWYDAGLGRWWSVDPIAAEFPNWSPYNFVKNNPIRLVDPTGMAPDDYVYLNTNGEEIGRIKDDKVKQVTVIKDENLQKFDALPYGRESIDDAAALGTTYEMKGVLSLYDKSSKDLADPYQDGSLKIADGTTGEPRYDIASEHGAYLKESNGTVSVGESYRGTPFNVSEPRPRNDDEVATVHTHPNTGKKEAVAAATGARYDWKHKGPSSSVDLATQAQPKQGYYNMVVDKSNVYFYKGTGSNATVITIPKSKL